MIFEKVYFRFLDWLGKEL